ncbi:MAG: hypothetical protein J5658_00415 [Prevotella sp.]|nr:hypothetical protein [Prevotella sp.]
MKRNIIFYVLAITFLSTVITTKADDDITATRNENGTWTFVKPADVDLKLKVVFFTKEELDSIAAQSTVLSSDSLLDISKDTIASENATEMKKATISKKKTNYSKRKRTRRKSRRR